MFKSGNRASNSPLYPSEPLNSHKDSIFPVIGL